MRVFGRKPPFLEDISWKIFLAGAGKTCIVALVIIVRQL
jgi:hypothetical protein